MDSCRPKSVVRDVFFQKKEKRRGGKNRKKKEGGGWVLRGVEERGY